MASRALQGDGALSAIGAATSLLALIAPLLGPSPSQAADPLWTGSRAAEARTEGLLKALRAGIGQGNIQFSNFPLIEDRLTHDFILHITTYGQEPNAQDWATALDTISYETVRQALKQTP